MYTLLIVDDEPKIREEMKRILPWEDYGITRIETAGSCSEAVARAVDSQPAIGLFDVCIGTEYGYDLINRLTETRLKFSEYLMLYRLTAARSRILETDEKIADIAAGVGYQNLNYFYQHFHNYYNQTPSEMRNRHRA